MRLFLTVKQLGARKPVLANHEIDVPPPGTVRELLEILVRREVERYNAKSEEKAENDAGPGQRVDPLTAASIEDQAETGKVAFNRRYNREADAEKAVRDALDAYRDGLFKVFRGDEELGGLDEKVSLVDGDTLTLIRLVMLSGTGDWRMVWMM